MTALEDLFGIQLPIIQAPMAGVQDSALAIAVSNAGGLGSLPCTTLNREQMRAEIAAIQAGTSSPFNLNFFCPPPPSPDPQREKRWCEALQPYYREFGIDPESTGAAAQRTPFTS